MQTFIDIVGLVENDRPETIIKMVNDHCHKLKRNPISFNIIKSDDGKKTLIITSFKSGDNFQF